MAKPGPGVSPTAGTAAPWRAENRGKSSPGTITTCQPLRKYGIHQQLHCHLGQCLSEPTVVFSQLMTNIWALGSWSQYCNHDACKGRSQHQPGSKGKSSMYLPVRSLVSNTNFLVVTRREPSPSSRATSLSGR